jgi:hypothetical protein
MISYEQICKVLKGIDLTEAESPRGWWGTEQGAAFGKAKMTEIRQLFSDDIQPADLLHSTKGKSADVKVRSLARSLLYLYEKMEVELPSRSGLRKLAGRENNNDS